MNKEFFPKRPEASPTIYAYEDTNPQYAGLLKVGYPKDYSHGFGTGNYEATRSPI